jgi:hypothetical protein
MGVFTYIQKDTGYHTSEIMLDDESMKGWFFPVGETWKDYLDGKWVLLSEGQLAFRSENPGASIKEVFDMELLPPPPEPPKPPKPSYEPYDYGQMMLFTWGLMEGLGIPPKEEEAEEAEEAEEIEEIEETEETGEGGEL